MNFRKLKKALKKGFADERFSSVTCCQVHIKFSKEIARWDKNYYYESVKFTEFWDKFNGRKDTMRYGNWHWSVVYRSRKAEALAERGEYPTSYIRYLVNDDTCVMLNANGMSVLLINRPNKYRTTVAYDLEELYKAMDECAKYCGGTVEFTYTEQQRLPFMRKAYKTLVLGKNVYNK